MFDEPNQNKIPEPPKNLAAEPVDMFAGLDEEKNKVTEMSTALNAGVLKKKEPEVNTLPPIGDELKPGAVSDGEMYAVKNPIIGKIIMVLVIIGVMGGIGWGVWKYYLNRAAEKAPSANLPTLEEMVIPEDQNTAPIVSGPSEPVVEPVEPVTNTAAVDMGNDAILFGEAIDTDKDGLDDVREKELGTSVTNVDTDADGLNDADEVIIWKTDPLNPDTDGDSYKDGEEIRNNYNPLGPGKLFVNQNQTNAVTATGTEPK